MNIFKRNQQLEQERHGKGAYIFQEGDFGEHAYRILQGSIEISISKGEERVVLAELGTGEVFGEMGMIGRLPRSANAMCLNAVKLEVLTEDDFNKALRENTEALHPYLSSIFGRMRHMNSLISESDAKIATYQDINKDRDLDNETKVSKCRIVADSDALKKQDVLNNKKIDEFPFFIGRRLETAAVDVFKKNHLAIYDERPYNVSRRHCSIEFIDDKYYIRDRGSHSGTIVNGVRINGSGTNEDTIKLNPGENSVILGSLESNIRLKIILDAG